MAYLRARHIKAMELLSSFDNPSEAYERRGEVSGIKTILDDLSEISILNGVNRVRLAESRPAGSDVGAESGRSAGRYNYAG